eukprot:CAMPEP_0113582746 /NCGR_PEP_ID=MMETSP0015_2-20120614/32096_1 /TAXON_ID=2838 /ORGANISM="Odontella" /LENGTH=104 /DNA_ID=CAMNT_0000487473 /DNA_START=189 /DNA_END=503 /DNA_ORIENTATION=+ /assembly_acc=CAM_ASM_000160
MDGSSISSAPQEHREEEPSVTSTTTRITKKETEEEMLRAAALDKGETGYSGNSDKEGDESFVSDEGVRKRCFEALNKAELVSIVEEILSAQKGWAAPSKPGGYS